MPSARALLTAESLRREAEAQMPEGVRVEIYAIVPNPWTGRTETYMKVVNTKQEEPHDHPNEDPPDE